MKKENKEVPAQSKESEKIDRILNEAYALMYKRQKIMKVVHEDHYPPNWLLEAEQAKGELELKIEELQLLGMTEGALGKLRASLEDPRLTKY